MKKALFIILTLCCSTILYAQKKSGSKPQKLYIGNSTQAIIADFTASDFSKPESVQYKVGQARIKLGLTYLSELDYLSLYGNKEVKVEFSIIFKDKDENILEQIIDKKLIANSLEPEQLYVYNFHKFLNEVDVVDISAKLTQETLSQGVDTRILNDLILDIGYEITYLTDVRSGIDQPLLGITNDLVADITPGQRKIKFKWIPEFDAPYYEFQLLRLDEVNQLDKTGVITGDGSFYTDLDWKNALSVEIHNYNNQVIGSDYRYLDLTLAEQGYYTWRVRPVGSYYGKGKEYAFGDARNYGAWSEHLENGKNLLVSPSMNDLPYLFHFEDPDKNINYAYQRVLTEGGKLHESLSYADGLLRTKQSQTYLSSNDEKKIILTQNIYDYTGRPTLQLIPVPVEGDGALIGYMKNEVLNSAGNAYTADDFDKNNSDIQGSNYNSPGEVKGSAYEYYNKPGAKERVASTGGYPFSRTIMINDGTERPLIQSGVGENFVMGNSNKNEVTYFYSQPSDHELIRVFGEEALPKEAVLKVITKDPDGTTSVSYVTNEGTTIATALVFKNLQEYTKYKQVNNLSATDIEDIEFQEKISVNDTTYISRQDTVLIEYGETKELDKYGKFKVVSTSSKEFAFTNGIENLRISYRLSSEEEIIIGCSGYNYANCGPTVRINIKDDKGNIVAIISPKTTETRIVVGDEYTATINPSQDNPGNNDNMGIKWMGTNTGLLADKTYYIEKILYVIDQDNVSGTVTDRAEVLTAIADMVGSWLAESTTQSAMFDFYASTQNFSGLLQNAITSNCDPVKKLPKENAPDFVLYGDERVYLNELSAIKHYCTGFSGDNGYIDLFPSTSISYTDGLCNSEDYKPYLSLTADQYCVLKEIGFYIENGINPIELGNNTGNFVSAEKLRTDQSTIDNFNPDVFKMTTHCCGDIVLSVNGLPKPMCPDKFSELEENRANEMLTIAGKFVDYLQINIVDNEELELKDMTLEKLTPGYSALTLKSMFFHMMFDKYELAPGQEEKEQYTCKTLWAGVQSTALTYVDLVEQYNDLKDADLRNPDGSEEEETGNGKKEQNDEIEENFGKSIMAWFIKTFILGEDEKMSSKVPEQMPFNLEYDFVDQFLNSVGYKYCKLVTSQTTDVGMLAKLKHNYPKASDYSALEMPDFLKDFETSGILISNYYASFDANGVPVSPSDPKNYGYANQNGYEKLLYTNSPVYRFKYAEYGPVKNQLNTTFTTSGNNAQRELQLETNYCFLDYNNILNQTYLGAEFCTPVCQGKSDYTQWSSREIKNYLKTLIASKGIVQPEPLVFKEEFSVGDVEKKDLMDLAIDLMDTCGVRCESRRPYIRLLIMREFEQNCYNIVSCADDATINQVTDVEIDEIVNSIISNCKDGCDNLVKNSRFNTINGCESIYYDGIVDSDETRIEQNSAYPCLKAMSGCYTLGAEYSQAKMIDISFPPPQLDTFHPYILSAEQQKVYEQLLGWELEFSLDGTQNRCNDVPTADLPCWLTVPQTCNQAGATYSEAVHLDMSQK